MIGGMPSWWLRCTEQVEPWREEGGVFEIVGRPFDLLESQGANHFSYHNTVTGFVGSCD